MTNNAPPNKRNESGRTREESVEAVFYPDCMQKVFKTHLYYEIGRLLEMYKLLLEPKRYAGLSAELVRTLDDALIVGFCTHARNLMEFFFRTRNNSHEYAIARDYANAQYVPLNRRRADVERLYGQLCAQINHLTYKRTDDNLQKIAPEQRKELVQMIHEEANRLQKYLLPDYDPKDLQIERLADAKGLQIGTRAVGTTTTITIHRGGTDPSV